MCFEPCAQASFGSQFLSVVRMVRENSAPAWFEYLNSMLWLPVRMIGQKWTSYFSPLQWASKVVQQQA
jgi:hypothetical protein